MDFLRPILSATWLQSEASKELPNCADDVESGLPARGQDWLALEDVAKVATESRNRNHSTVDLSIETPGTKGQHLAWCSKKGSLTIRQHT